MANVLVNEKTLKAIADAVRAQGGTSALMKPGEIPDAVSRIPSGGSAADMSLPVRFFDYDGTLLYSCTAFPLRSLQGWNDCRIFRFTKDWSVRAGTGRWRI